MGVQEPFPIIAKPDIRPEMKSGAIAYLRDVAIVMAMELPQPVTMFAGTVLFSVGQTEMQRDIGCYGLVGVSFLIGAGRGYVRNRRNAVDTINTPEAD